MARRTLGVLQSFLKKTGEFRGPRAVQSARFQLKILGPTELAGPAPDAGEAVARQPKRLALLSYLALTTADGFRRRDKVIALFWPELDQAQARTYLRKALFGINEALGAEVFATRGEDEIRVAETTVWCDAVALPRLTAEGRCHDALALYRGDLLEGLFPDGVAQDFHQWLEDQRRLLREQAAAAAWECSRVEEERGDRRAAAVMARRALELTPDDEVGTRRLMALLDQHGDRAGALRVYAEWQARLKAEYGVEPAPETRKLARKVQAARKGESHETPPATIVTRLSGPDPVVAVASPSVASATVGRARRRLVEVVALVVVAVLAGGAVSLMRGRGLPEADAASLAILPLREIGAGAGSEAARITEELMTALARERGIAVRTIARLPGAAGNDMNLEQLGERLGLAFVVDGGLQSNATTARVTLRLVRTSDGVSVWAAVYDYDTSDPMTAAREAAAQAAREIASRLLQGAAGSTDSLPANGRRDRK